MPHYSCHDSPRMRGGQPFAEERMKQRKVFSPHARGSTHIFSHFSFRMPILPTCAGVNPSASNQGHCGRNFPRMREGQPAEQSAQFSIGNSPCMRGGQPRTPSPFEGDIGFSPHARGSTRSNRVDDTGGTILPACAGVNPRNGYGQFRWNDSPRMRGGHPFARVALRASLFTPHARGSTLFIDWPFDGVSIHPACAGVNPPTDRLLCSYAHSPRMRGDQPR